MFANGCDPNRCADRGNGFATCVRDAARSSPPKCARGKVSDWRRVSAWAARVTSLVVVTVAATMAFDHKGHFQQGARALLCGCPGLGLKALTEAIARSSDTAKDLFLMVDPRCWLLFRCAKCRKYRGQMIFLGVAGSCSRGLLPVQQCFCARGGWQVQCRAKPGIKLL